MASTTDAMLPGFTDYGREANAVFRTCLEALSRPGKIFDLPKLPDAPSPLQSSAAAVLLTLIDYETTLWLDADLAANAGVAEYLRFHTGARLSSATSDADFAVISAPNAMPPFTEFKQGTPEFPDRSTTLIVQVDRLEAEGMTFSGPGIEAEISFSATPLPENFAAQLLANRAQFPLGVDLIFVSEAQIAALPRSINMIGSV